MARKSLIEPGLIPANGDVFSRILANDRERRRQEAAAPHAEEPTDSPAAPPPQETPIVQEPADLPESPTDSAPPSDNPERYNVTSNPVNNVTTLQVTSEPKRSDGRTKRRGGSRPVQASPDPDTVSPAMRRERFQKAIDLAAGDEIAVVTVRVSHKLNEYLDRYVERSNRVHPQRRYRKQDAVAEAFAAFFADHPLPPMPEEDEL